MVTVPLSQKGVAGLSDHYASWSRVTVPLISAPGGPEELLFRVGICSVMEPKAGLR